jgi:hypothetical protein
MALTNKIARMAWAVMAKESVNVSHAEKHLPFSTSVFS